MDVIIDAGDDGVSFVPGGATVGVSVCKPEIDAYFTCLGSNYARCMSTLSFTGQTIDVKEATCESLSSTYFCITYKLCKRFISRATFTECEPKKVALDTCNEGMCQINCYGEDTKKILSDE